MTAIGILVAVLAFFAGAAVAIILPRFGQWIANGLAKVGIKAQV